MNDVAKIGYARVSTKGQNDDSQVDDLTAYGCDKIFIDHGISGKHAARPEFDAALEYMREGDVFVITRLSRAMRSIHDLLDVVNGTRDSGSRTGERTGGLNGRGIGLVVIKQGIDTTSPQGRLVFHIMAALDEFQRELIVEGTREGLSAARARGRTGGRKPKLNERQAATLRRMYDAKGPDGKRQHTVAEIAEAVGVSRPTVYDYLRKDQAAPGGK
jgi:DNA invertase Pin-like site-specific DNA recombinase